MNKLAMSNIELVNTQKLLKQLVCDTSQSRESYIHRYEITEETFDAVLAAWKPFEMYRRLED